MNPQKIGFLTSQILLIIFMSLNGQISAKAETGENSIDGNALTINEVTTNDSISGQVNKKQSLGLSPKYRGEISLCYGTSTKVQGYDTYSQRVSLGTVQGVALNEFLQFGIGIDIDCYTHYYKDKEPYKSADLSGFRMSMKEFVDTRGRYPLNDNFAFILDLGLGIYHGLLHFETKPAFYWQFGPGIECRHFTFYTGLQSFGTGPSANTWFARVAVNF